MTTLLQINTSLFSDAGASSALANRFVAEWQRRHPEGRVVRRDLAATPLPHLDAERFAAYVTPAEERTARQRELAAESQALIDELRDADVVVLGLPMYNFGVPSTLKAYFDRLARAGITFRYTANGPEGLLADRPVKIFATRGGYYRDTPADVQTGFVTRFLALLGLRDVEFVYAEGLNINEDIKREALTRAGDEITRLAA